MIQWKSVLYNTISNMYHVVWCSFVSVHVIDKWVKYCQLCQISHIPGCIRSLSATEATSVTQLQSLINYASVHD